MKQKKIHATRCRKLATSLKIVLDTCLRHVSSRQSSQLITANDTYTSLIPRRKEEEEKDLFQPLITKHYTVHRFHSSIWHAKKLTRLYTSSDRFESINRSVSSCGVGRREEARGHLGFRLSFLLENLIDK